MKLDADASARLEVRRVSKLRKGTPATLVAVTGAALRDSGHWVGVASCPTIWLLALPTSGAAVNTSLVRLVRGSTHSGEDSTVAVRIAFVG
jgi:hypothetical protein